MILTWHLGSDVVLGLIRAIGGGLSGPTSTFVEPQVMEGPSGDLHRLVNFVACMAVEEASRRRERRQAIRDEPRLINRVGMRVQNVLRR